MEKLNPEGISFLSHKGQLRVALVFLGQLLEAEQRLARAFEMREKEDLAIIGHSLKSSCRTFDAENLASYCELLERSKKDPTIDLAELVAPTMQELSLVATRIRELVERLQDAGRAT